MRLIAAGEAHLMEGFVLLGFETLPDATPAQAEQMLCQLLRRPEKALVFLEQTLVGGLGKCHETLRRESGKVVIVEIPPLNHPASYQPPVEALARRVLGESALEPAP